MIKSLIPLFLILTIASTRAEETIIGQTPYEGSIYEVQVPYTDFVQVNQAQQQSEWCWAASISNLFRFYGHPMNQEDIVMAVYNRVVNLPAMDASVVASLVNRNWTDSNGKKFKARLTGVFDVKAGIGAFNNAGLIDNLRHNRPMLVCNTHHVMVITEARFTANRILSVGVFDPWPAGPETHSLTALEMVPAPMGQLMFVAAVSVTDLVESHNAVNSGSENHLTPTDGPSTAQSPQGSTVVDPESNKLWNLVNGQTYSKEATTKTYYIKFLTPKVAELTSEGAHGKNVSEGSITEINAKDSTIVIKWPDTSQYFWPNSDRVDTQTGSIFEGTASYQISDQGAKMIGNYIEGFGSARGEFDKN